MISPAAHRVPTPGVVLSRVWVWLQAHPVIRWVMLFCVVCSVCYWAPAAFAWANPEGGASAASISSFLPLGDLTDSQGVPLARYQDLPADPGNGPTYVLRSIRYVIASLAWALYALPILVIIAVLNWILDFEWLEWLAAPFENIANGVSAVLGSGVGTPVLITLGVGISSLVIGFGYIRGRTGAASVEAVMVILFFGIVTSSVITPVSWIAGDEGGAGLFEQSADIGQEAGALTVNNGDTVETATLASSLADITLRDTMLSMAFGSDLTGDLEECGETFNEVAADAENDAEDIRKEVIDCDDAVADANQTDGYSWLFVYLMALPAALGVLALVGVFLFFLIKEVGQGLISCFNIIVRGFFAVFPGGSRQAFLNAIAQLFVSVVIVGVYIWALTVYLWLVVSVLTEYIPTDIMRIGAIFVGIAMIILGVTFFKMKKAGKSIGERIARMLGRTGLAKDSPEPRPSRFGSTVGNLAKAGLDTYNQSKIAKAALTTAAVAGTGGVGGAAVKGAGSMAAKSAAKSAAGSGARALTGAPGGGAPAGSLPSGAGGGSPAGSFSAEAAGSHTVAAELPAPTSSGMQAQAAVGPRGTPEPPAGGEPQVAASVPTSGAQDGPKQPAPPGPSRRSNNTGAGRREAAASDQDRLRHVPPGRHGNTWVHRNGQVSTPRTMTESGKPVRTVPSDDQLSRAWKSGDSWVVSDARPEGVGTSSTPPPMRSPRKQGE